MSFTPIAGTVAPFMCRLMWFRGGGEFRTRGRVVPAATTMNAAVLVESSADDESALSLSPVFSAGADNCMTAIIIE